MNRIGLHSGYWRGTSSENDIRKMVQVAKKTGLDLIELQPHIVLDLSKTERLELKNYLQDSGIFHTFNGGLNANNDISSDDTKIRQNGIDYCKRVLEAIADTGADIWSGINYSAWLRRPDKILDLEEKKRIREISLNSLREIIKTAEEYDILYCFEIVNRYEQFILNTVQEGVEFAEELDSPNAKLLIDTFHMNIEEDSISEAIHFAGQKDMIGHVHVGEANRRLPGQKRGHIDWHEVFLALNQVNYQGSIVMEPFLLMGIPSALNNSVWRDMSEHADLEKLISFVNSSAIFIRSYFKDS